MINIDKILKNTKIIIGFLITVSFIIFVQLLTNNVNAQQEDTTVGSNDMVNFLAKQHSQSEIITKINSTSYQMELNKILNQTILFSDGSNRIVNSITTSDFIGNWTVGPDSFAIDPPNAVLV